MCMCMCTDIYSLWPGKRQLWLARPASVKPVICAIAVSKVPNQKESADKHTYVPITESKLHACQQMCFAKTQQLQGSRRRALQDNVASLGHLVSEMTSWNDC